MIPVGLRLAGIGKKANGAIPWASFSTITIDHTKVGSSSHTNFPFLFFGTYSQLATVAHGGNATSSSGFDIAFSTDSAGTMLIPFELVNYDPTSGACEFWVSVPSVSDSVDTVIYVQCGYAGWSSNHSTPATVWAGFKAVYHLGDGSTLSMADSSQTGNGLTNAGGTAVAGQIDGAISFVSTYAQKLSGIGLPLGNVQPVIVSGWFKLNNNQTQETWGFGNNTGSDCRVAFFYDGSNHLLSEFGGVGNSFSWTYDSSWHHAAVVIPAGSTNINQSLVYLDGVLQSPTLSSAALNLTGSDIVLGGIPGAPSAIGANCYVDEVHIGTIAPNADWILAEFNNQNSPSTFYTVT